MAKEQETIKKTVNVTLKSHHEIPSVPFFEHALSLFDEESLDSDEFMSEDDDPMLGELSEEEEEREYERIAERINELLDAQQDENGEFESSAEYEQIESDLLTSLLDKIKRECEKKKKKSKDDDYNFGVFSTIAEMECEYTENSRVFTISYTEDESLGGTETKIVIDVPEAEDENMTVAILRSGDVMSTIVCEEKVRHISVYKTPMANFEAAVYTRSLKGGMTAAGGILEMEYIVELRGMDAQYTKMIIEVRK